MKRENEKGKKEKQGMFWVSMICFISFVSFYLHLEEILDKIGMEYRSWAAVGGKILFWVLFAWLALSAVRYRRSQRTENARGPLITGILLIVFLAGAGGFAGLTKSSLIRPVEKEYEENGVLKVQPAGNGEPQEYVPIMGIFRISEDNLEALKNKGYSGIYAVLDNLPLDKQEEQAPKDPADSPDNAESSDSRESADSSQDSPGSADRSQDSQESPDDAESPNSPSEDIWLDGSGDPEMEKQLEAARLIYDQCLKEKGYSYGEGVNAKGEWYIDVGGGKRLIYDRMSKNGKCYLFALNAADYSALEDYYAVNLDTKEVIASGKHSYSQSGSEAYHKATGEY